MMIAGLTVEISYCGNNRYKLPLLKIRTEKKLTVDKSSKWAGLKIFVLYIQMLL